MLRRMRLRPDPGLPPRLLRRSSQRRRCRQAALLTQPQRGPAAPQRPTAAGLPGRARWPPQSCPGPSRRQARPRAAVWARPAAVPAPPLQSRGDLIAVHIFRAMCPMTVPCPTLLSGLVLNTSHSGMELSVGITAHSGQSGDMHQLPLASLHRFVRIRQRLPTKQAHSKWQS